MALMQGLPKSTFPQPEAAPDVDLCDQSGGKPAAAAHEAPLTMEGLVAVVAELNSSREAEGRMQMYRLQEHYEKKLESVHVKRAYLHMGGGAGS